MQKILKATLLILAFSTILVAPASAQTKEIGIYKIWTDQYTYDPGETVTVTLELVWDFPASTDISPGVWDPTNEVYIAEDVYTVTGVGSDNVTLSFPAENVNGVYEYIVNVFYEDEGWTMSETGYEAHSLYIQVGTTGSGEYNAWVTKVDSPNTVKPSESFNVTVHVDMSFPTMTTFSVGITDPSTGEAIMEIEDQTEGEQSGVYWFELIAPDTEGTYTLGADIIFETDAGWTYTEDAAQMFDISVKEGGGAIPGFPTVSILAGSLVALA
ncbi:MAG: hypothetical protein ACWGQW_15250, partial [bacterium]